MRAPRYIYPGEGIAGVSADSYEGVQSAKPHWMVRLPLVGRALPFLSLTACGLGSSCGTEVKVAVGIAATTGVVGLLSLLNRSINNRRISELPSPLQMMKYGFPRVRFPRKLDSAEKVIALYMSKGLSKEAARGIAYAWHFRGDAYSEGIGDLSKYDLQRGDLHGVISAFANLANYSFDSNLLDKVDRVGCSRAMGEMLSSLDRGIRTVPELVNVFFALNLKRYHSRLGSHGGVTDAMRYILNKFSSGSEVKYQVGEYSVAKLFKSSSVKHRSDKEIADGVAHLLFGGMALDAYETGQFDGGLELGYAHIWGARECFMNLPELTRKTLDSSYSVKTVTEGHFRTLNDRAQGMWQTAFSGMQRPTTPWSSSMISATTRMLKSFSIKLV